MGSGGVTRGSMPSIEPRALCQDGVQQAAVEIRRAYARLALWPSLKTMV
jgi:hypothetical protein